MRAVALMLSVTLFATACFPKEPRKRFYAQLTEGGTLAGGIALLAASNTGADCDQNQMAGHLSTMGCKQSAGTISTIGLGLILLGLVGFIATVSSAEDEKPAPVITPLPTPPPPPTAGSGSASPPPPTAGSAAAVGSGSAAP